MTDHQSSEAQSRQGSDADIKRSPVYPSIDLEAALQKLDLIWKADKGAPAAPEVIANHLGSSVKSSGFLQSLASLGRYGLLEELDGKPRRLRITKPALDILMLPESDPKRKAAIKQAAVTPRAFQQLWEEYGTNLPSDQNLQHQLVTSKKFRPDAAVDLIKQYKKTISFAKLGEGDKITGANLGKPPEIGDLVQWESQGALQFPEPYRIKGKNDDGSYAFFEEFQAGVPIAELKVIQGVTAQKLSQMMDAVMPPAAAAKSAAPPLNPNFKPPAPPDDSREFTLTTDTGPVVLRWPVSLSKEDYDMAETWLEGLKKKMKRTIVDDIADEK